MTVPRAQQAGVRARSYRACASGCAVKYWPTGMTELIPDDHTVWAARRVAAEFPSGEVKLAGVRTAIPAPIAAILRGILEDIALGKSVSVVVSDPKTDRVPMQLLDKLIADGKVLLD